ncbi:MAG: hypothetical protein WCF24_11995, partial [Acidimicrobiales bacterium]
PWLSQAVGEASESYYARAPFGYGVGGSIPFMSALGVRYPNAQFFSTGALGADSNAHGIDESLHIPTVKALTASVAEVIATLAAQPDGQSPANT